MAQKQNDLASSTIGGTSARKFHALKEATEWHLPDEQRPTGENPEHREAFERLVESAIKGKKEA